MGSFQLNGATVLEVNTGSDLATVLAPRPYLHPVRTLAGVPVTEAGPGDHPHHLGLSLAFSDLNGTNFWGGSTFTENGPAILPNHGRQLLAEWLSLEGLGKGTVVWLDKSGDPLAVEERSYRYREHPAANTWSLAFESLLQPAGDVAQLSVSSSAVKGRSGAGYGGIFWRFPTGDVPAKVLCSDGAGADAAHGSLSRWLTVRTRHEGKSVSVILAQDTSMLRPWFVRTDGYLGAGPAVAWDQPATVDRDNPLKLSLHAVVHDGSVTSPRHVEELLLHHFSSSADRTS